MLDLTFLEGAFAAAFFLRGAAFFGATAFLRLVGLGFFAALFPPPVPGGVPSDLLMNLSISELAKVPRKIERTQEATFQL